MTPTIRAPSPATMLPASRSLMRTTNPFYFKSCACPVPVLRLNSWVAPRSVSLYGGSKRGLHDFSSSKFQEASPGAVRGWNIGSRPAELRNSFSTPAQVGYQAGLPSNRLVGTGHEVMVDAAPLAFPSANSRTTTPPADLPSSGYQLPPAPILDIVDAPPQPALSLSPDRKEILYLHRPALTPVAELARPELKLAGVRVDPECNSRSRMSFYTALTIHPIMEDGSPGEERKLTGLPEGAKINFLSWSPDGRHLAFSVRRDEKDGTRSMLSLWVAPVDSMAARQLVDGLNTVFDSYTWVDDARLCVFTVPPNRGPPPSKPLLPAGPNIQRHEGGENAQSRTFQDLLKDETDERLFEHYATSQLLMVSLGGEVEAIGTPRMYSGVEPSPDARFLLVGYIERPFSFTVLCGRFPKRVEVWEAGGGRVVHEVAALPLAENIPIASNSTRPGRRSIGWRADKPSALWWVETQDGGDAKVEVSPRDIVYTSPAQLGEGVEPQVVAELDLRCSSVLWGHGELALVSESWRKTRQTRTWAISPDHPQKAKRKVFDRSYEDAYSNPGSPMLRRTSRGTYILACVADEGGGGRERLLLDGQGATPQGDVPFLDLFDVESGEKERIWESSQEGDVLETVVSILEEEGEEALDLSKLKFLMARESVRDPPQYFMKRLGDDKAVQISDFPHPYPSLRDLSQELITYSRADGVQLTARLYLPPGYDAARDGPLPLLMWAYPREFKSREAAGQVRGNPRQFAAIGPSSEALFLALGYAVLSGPSMPIVGEGEVEANDSFVEQLVSGAQAAVDEVVRRGVADVRRIAMGGHSYGAFTVANLLVHAPDLLCCGVAQSGAYNRTFTPFGFQSEERTIWEAPETYMAMSPFMGAHKVKAPVLLIHGEEDTNTGTFPMQSERFFAALKGHGVECRLVLLPFETHGYAGRESVLHRLAEVSAWLDKHCKGQQGELPEPANGSMK